MSKTVPELQKDVNVLLTSLSVTTEMFGKLVPTEEEIKKMEAKTGRPDLMQHLLLVILRSQVQINRDLIVEMRLDHPDAELQDVMAKIDEIRANRTV